MDSTSLPNQTMAGSCYRVDTAEFQGLVDRTTVPPKKWTPKSPRSGVGGFIVKSVHRIHNPQLLEKYNTKKASIRQIRKLTDAKLIGLATAVDYLPLQPAPKLDVDVNEGYLFHSVREKQLTAVKQNGFEPRMGSKACSFTDSISNADQDIDPNDECIWVFVVRVCLGRTWTSGDHGCIPKLPGFDSTLMDTDAPGKEFRIFDKHQAYPEFLMKLIRKRSDSPRNPDPAKWTIDETCAWAETVIPPEQAQFLKTEEVSGRILLVLDVDGIEECGILPEHARTINTSIHELKTRFTQPAIEPVPFFHPMDPNFVVNTALNCSPEKFCHAAPEQPSPSGILEVVTHRGLEIFCGLAEDFQQMAGQLGKTVQRCGDFVITKS